MYSPEAFREQRLQYIAALIRQHGLATVISVDDGLPVISHIPLMFERGDGDTASRLTGHLVRANPQAALLANDRPVTAIFHGPDAYVSPRWYRSPGVPTWNYAVVHIRGRSCHIDEEQRLLQLLDRLTAAHEADGEPIALPGERRRPLLQAIVGFDICIDDIEAKFKLSQNRPAADQPGILAGLEAGGAAGRQVAGWMRRLAGDNTR